MDGKKIYNVLPHEHHQVAHGLIGSSYSFYSLPAPRLHTPRYRPPLHPLQHPAHLPHRLGHGQLQPSDSMSGLQRCQFHWLPQLWLHHRLPHPH